MCVRVIICVGSSYDKAPNRIHTSFLDKVFLLFLNQEKHIIHAAMYTRGSVLSQAGTFHAVVGLVDNRDKVVKESAFVALSHNHPITDLAGQTVCVFVFQQAKNPKIQQLPWD